jgi:hypothetical protein
MSARTRALLLAATVVLSALGSLDVAMAKGGGTPPPPATGSSSITVSPLKIPMAGAGTGTITLPAVATAPVVISLFDDYQNSPAVATMPSSVTVPAGARTATFPIQGGDAPDRTFLVHLSTNQPGLQTQFYRTPLANTDVIAITNASQSRSGDVRFTATSDTPAARLAATFNGIAIPLTNKGNGVWEGKGQVGANQSGDVVVTSDLHACSAKNPNTPSGWHFC